jgi:hypothetical protein
MKTPPQAALRISLDELHELLGLPEDCRLIQIVPPTSEEVVTQSFRIVVEHPALWLNARPMVRCDKPELLERISSQQKPDSKS